MIGFWYGLGALATLLLATAWWKARTRRLDYEADLRWAEEWARREARMKTPSGRPRPISEIPPAPARRGWVEPPRPIPPAPAPRSSGILHGEKPTTPKPGRTDKPIRASGPYASSPQVDDPAPLFDAMIRQAIEDAGPDESPSNDNGAG